MSKFDFLFQRISRGILFLALPGILLAASPPPLINYQGVLRSATDEPLTGTYDMTFRFFDAENGGNEILVDEHLAASAQAVGVDGGLFAVELGGGLVTDGSGPGTYTALDTSFRDHDEVWLEVQIGAETLVPRTRVMAAGYALNATTAGTSDQLNGQPSDFYLDTSSTGQTKAGTVHFHASDPTRYVVDLLADPGSPGALFATSSGATCRIAYGDKGTECYGNYFGGFFYDSTDNSYAYAGYGGYGIYAGASSYGGFFNASAAGGTGVYGSAPTR